MKMTIESTTQIVLVSAKEPDQPIACRIWEGVTAKGIPVQVLVARIAALETEDFSQFDAELIEQKAPSAAVRAFPLRMIL
jgi:hypothetical protein